MPKLSLTIALFIAAAATACSSSSTTPSSSSSTSSGSSSGGATASSSGDTTAGAPKAPTITDIMKMSGALHVSWTNNETSCDEIDGERQAKMADGSIMEPYKQVFTVSGDADNKHDTTATENMTYTYRLRCKKGGAFSDYSNEMSGNPTQ